MELHSYAKRKTSKKWTVQQKRRLVETRINYDSIFNSQPRNSMLPWKRVLNLADLEDFSIFFVRKQWSSMVEKYKVYKENRLQNIPSNSIDDDTVEKISEEWEFFKPIHRYMTSKTTNLHSYAQTFKTNSTGSKSRKHKNVNIKNENSNENIKAEMENEASVKIPVLEPYFAFSSDTNEEFNDIEMKDESPSQNTDHDFYTKKVLTDQLNYFADISDDTHESVTVELRTTSPPPPSSSSKTVTVNTNSNNILNNNTSKKVKNNNNNNNNNTSNMNMNTSHKNTNDMEDVMNATKKTIGNGNQSSTKHNTAVTHKKSHNSTGPSSNFPLLSERDKYYRHKRRFNRRLERRFDSLLNVFGQIVKAEYPNIDVTPILGTVQNGTNMIRNLFSSDDDDEEEDDDNDDYVDENQENLNNTNTQEYDKNNPNIVFNNIKCEAEE